MKPLYGDWKSTPPEQCLQEGEYLDQETLYHFRENAGNQSEDYIQINEVVDIAGGKPLYDTAYKEGCSPWIYAGQCYAGEKENRNPALMPMVYICSQYRAETRQELEEHIEVAKWAARLVTAKGKIPIAPHLYFPRFMNDSLPEERYFGMEAGKRFMERCREFLVVTVNGTISSGMKEEIEYMTETLLLKGDRINLGTDSVEEIMKNRLES